jgi:Fe2+ transport system protein FeoA
MTLNDISPGRPARIAGFSDDIAAQQREYLQAFGVVAGRTVRVLQQSPVTVVRIEHLELAIESELAARVTVEAYDPTSSSSDVGIPPPAP